jgi:hypothetical protein
MRVYSGAIGTVRYPDSITFAFNPNRIIVGTDVPVTVTVGRYTDTREPYQTMVEIDIAKYLQAMVSKENRHKEVEVSLSSDRGSFSFTTLVVWGAMNIGETFNKPYTLYWWKGLPFTMELYVADGAEGLRARYDRGAYGAGIRNRGMVSFNPAEMWPDANEQVVLRVDDLPGVYSVWDYTFDNTFNGVNKDTVHLYRLKVQEAKECGVYLRWIDRHGWMRYWLFEKGQITTMGKSLDALKGVHEGVSYEYRMARYAGKEASKSVKLCAPLITDEETDIVEQVALSPVVDMWTGKEWIPVNIEAFGVTRGGKDWRPLNNFECVMVYPELMVQRL